MVTGQVTECDASFLVEIVCRSNYVALAPPAEKRANSMQSPES